MMVMMMMTNTTRKLSYESRVVYYTFTNEVLMTHTDGNRLCVSVRVSVCLCIRPRSKTRVINTNVVHIYCMAGSRYSLILRSKGQRSRSHG